MRKIITVFASVALGLFLLTTVLLRFVSTRTGHHAAIYDNLRRLDSAKQQCVMEQKAPPDSWPTKSNILPYLARNPNSKFDEVIPSVCGEVYIINRADRPVLVYFPKDIQNPIEGVFRGGMLMTMEDLQNQRQRKPVR
jgi:hypothetical protein